MDDLDAERSRPKYIAMAQGALEWLGLDWDGPIVVESSRREQIEEAARDLLLRGHAYPCVCTRGDLRSDAAAAGAPHAGSGELRYEGRCSKRFADFEEARRAYGRAAVRVRVPKGPVHFVDGHFGAQAEDVSATVGDFVILRVSGAPAYQLAVVLDDFWDGVTEVVRGADLLSSTARQIVLQEALGLPRPHTFHVPLICDETGKRLAKRHAAMSLDALKSQGVAPEAIVTWVLQASGQPLPAGERISAREATLVFDAAHLGREDVVAPAVEGLLKMGRRQ
jgi:glutamyl-tRNA synthetase